MFSIISGSCILLPNGGCVASDHYPSKYVENMSCEIGVTDPQPVWASVFSVQPNRDILTIPNASGTFNYSGSNAPPTGLVPTGTITWSSDASVNYQGWVLCPVATTTTTTRRTTSTTSTLTTSITSSISTQGATSTVTTSTTTRTTSAVAVVSTPSALSRTLTVAVQEWGCSSADLPSCAGLAYAAMGGDADAADACADSSSCGSWQQVLSAVRVAFVASIINVIFDAMGILAVAVALGGKLAKCPEKVVLALLVFPLCISFVADVVCPSVLLGGLKHAGEATQSALDNHCLPTGSGHATFVRMSDRFHNSYKCQVAMLVFGCLGICSHCVKFVVYGTADVPGTRCAVLLMLMADVVVGLGQFICSVADLSTNLVPALASLNDVQGALAGSGSGVCVYRNPDLPSLSPVLISQSTSLPLGLGLGIACPCLCIIFLVCAYSSVTGKGSRSQFAEVVPVVQPAWQEPTGGKEEGSEFNAVVPATQSA